MDPLWKSNSKKQQQNNTPSPAPLKDPPNTQHKPWDANTHPQARAAAEGEAFCPAAAVLAAQNPSLRLQQLCTATKSMQKKIYTLNSLFQPFNQSKVRSCKHCWGQGDAPLQYEVTQQRPDLQGSFHFQTQLPAVQAEHRTDLAHFGTFFCRTLHVSYLLRKASRQADLQG